MLPGFDVLWGFALIAALLTVTPGVDTAIVLRSAAASGQRRAFGVVVGVQCGVVVWGAAAAVGVSALLQASTIAYDIVRYAGAAYLLWIGVRLVIGAIRGIEHEAEADVEARGSSFSAGLWQGFVTNILNPKVGAFYVAVLPGLIPAEAPQLVWGIALALVHALLGVVWLGLVAVLAGSMRRWLARENVRRWIDGVCGVAIMAFGARLAIVR